METHQNKLSVFSEWLGHCWDPFERVTIIDSSLKSTAQNQLTIDFAQPNRTPTLYPNQGLLFKPDFLKLF